MTTRSLPNHPKATFVLSHVMKNTLSYSSVHDTHIMLNISPPCTWVCCWVLLWGTVWCDMKEQHHQTHDHVWMLVNIDCFTNDLYIVIVYEILLWVHTKIAINVSLISYWRSLLWFNVHMHDMWNKIKQLVRVYGAS